MLFRGLIAGSLARRLPFVWANLSQAAIFFLPHLAILFFAPELWGLLPLVFVRSAAVWMDPDQVRLNPRVVVDARGWQRDDGPDGGRPYGNVSVAGAPLVMRGR
jgi:hypothetical protein